MEDIYKVQQKTQYVEPIDDSRGYKTYTSKVISNDLDNFIENCNIAYGIFKNKFGEEADSTWSYTKYNIFSLTSSSLLFYNLFKELNSFVREYIGDNRPLWIQSWLNFHKSDQVLKKHEHGFTFHGYISIDPKNTTTVFEKYKIENTPGQIYIGPGGKGYEHYVRVNEPYEGDRITLGFDISSTPDLILLNQGFIPLI